MVQTTGANIIISRDCFTCQSAAIKRRGGRAAVQGDVDHEEHVPRDVELREGGPAPPTSSVTTAVDLRILKHVYFLPRWTFLVVRKALRKKH